ncbi:hypothetical protein Tco_0584479 [Tanacetum coccineum]
MRYGIACLIEQEHMISSSGEAQLGARWCLLAIAWSISFWDMCWLQQYLFPSTAFDFSRQESNVLRANDVFGADTKGMQDQLWFGFLWGLCPIFKGLDFRRWQNKIHFLLSSMSVLYVLTTPIPGDGGDDATVEQIKKKAKCDNDDYVCRGLILNEAKYMAEDASSKKFLVSNFINYKMTDSTPVLDQYNELLGILGRFTQHKINMDEAIQVSCIIDKLPPSWKDLNHTLKHLKEELTLIELGSHLRIEASLRVQDSDKPKGKQCCWSTVIGRGCVDLRFISGKIVSLFNVLHVPNIKKKISFK